MCLSSNLTSDFLHRTLQSWQRPESACINNCNCYTASVSPVCGSNGVTYLSACFAGCTKPVSGDNNTHSPTRHIHTVKQPFHRHRTNWAPLSLCQNLTSCTCISSNSEDAVALPGKCPSPGCQQAFLTFLCVICVCSMIGAMAQTPSVIILIRYETCCYTYTPQEGAAGICDWSRVKSLWRICEGDSGTEK